MTISSFDDLIAAAHMQEARQRLLFVFTNAELPDESTASMRQAFEAGHGGALVPVMCVDKTPEELPAFQMLVDEAQQFGQTWSMVFVTTMSGSNASAPDSAAAEKPLQSMVEAIKAGDIRNMIPFDRNGQAVMLSS